MTDKESELLNITANGLFAADIPVKCSDISKIFEESEKQAVSGIVYATAPDRLFSSAVRDHIATSARIHQAHVQLHRLLTDNNIKYVILKGCASSYYYPDQYLRTMGDVDFLVGTQDVKRTKKVLKNNGYILVSKKEAHHTVFKKDDIAFELHCAVNGIPDGEKGEICRKYLSGIIESSRTVSLLDGSVNIPDDFHHGLVLLLHNAQHMISSGLGLRHLCDWAVFVNKVPDFPEIFESALSDIGLWYYAKLLTAVCCRYVGLPNREWSDGFSDQLLEKLMDDILNSGNFGRKRSDNYSSWMITKVTSGGLSEGSFIKQMIKRADNITRTNWKRANDSRLLLMIGDIYFSARFVFRVMVGKRKKMNVRKMCNDANDRRTLYKEFHLFE